MSQSKAPPPGFEWCQRCEEAVHPAQVMKCGTCGQEGCPKCMPAGPSPCEDCMKEDGP